MKEYLEKKRKLIDMELERYLPGKAAYPRVVHEAMRDSVLSGGKRIRPILAMESAKICGGNRKDALRLACAIEFIHSYSLVHDDLPSMDDASMRRGRPSCHAKYGEAIAILAGDALLTLAFNVLSGIKDEKRMKRVVFELSKAIGTFGMIGGQVVDLEIKDKRPLNLPMLEYINLHKTASLIAASAKTGAVIAGAGEEKIKALESYGEYTGLAFQIVDDILDRDGYVGIFGINGAKEEAARLIEHAKGILAVFGKRAETLKRLSDFVLKRRK
ncbi:MAG: polyprenyl synthetase family protein [Candidatus Omnitrophica bacterium]|nr:polyprenyl synthetase family protein [Candidatus Omnitrophota bacterium]